MALSDAQIERYSRQIIVPRVGGRAQERLLASRLLVVGALDTITDPLAYLVGAGVGTIRLLAADGASRGAGLAARMRDLNSDVALSFTLSPTDDVDLLFAPVSDGRVLDAVRALPARVLDGPAVVLRLDGPARLAVLRSPPPCVRCAAGELLAPFGTAAGNAGFLAMAASVEALKLLAGYEPATGPSIIEFDGYACTSRPATLSDARRPRCVCGGKRE